ncbi:hypothetical protein VTN31DRAFT_5171 [Thermomyces dupontii]|uniref:uncharacterized protein n=1 Tax=Talaromyces thermophilus TaxID=28565 RepID=UPI003744217B
MLNIGITKPVQKRRSCTNGRRRGITHVRAWYGAQPDGRRRTARPPNRVRRNPSNFINLKLDSLQLCSILCNRKARPSSAPLMQIRMHS